MIRLHFHLLQRTDVPFAHTLAPYPVRTQRPVPPTFADQAEPHPAHVPGFLPAFPDPHTYQHTAAFAGHEADPHKQRQVRGVLLVLIVCCVCGHFRAEAVPHAVLDEP
jgi:hypothetical protein